MFGGGALAKEKPDHFPRIVPKQQRNKYNKNKKSWEAARAGRADLNFDFACGFGECLDQAERKGQPLQEAKPKSRIG